MEKQSRKKRSRGAIVTAALLLCCAAILADSRWRLSTEEYTLSSSRLPAAFEGFRILQLSDLHGMEFGEDNARLLKAVRRARPDIIAMTGDFIEGEKQLAPTENMCRELLEIAPVYFVSGNHDAGSGYLRELSARLQALGVHCLGNAFLPLQRNGEEILLCGVEDPNAWAEMPGPREVVRQMRREHPESFALLLGHRNDWPDKYPYLDVDVILSGHGHGGIVRLPLVGGLLGTSMDFFPEYDSGVFSTGRYQMVVSRGLGSAAPLPRFLNPPHIPVIVLTQAGDSL